MNSRIEFFVFSIISIFLFCLATFAYAGETRVFPLQNIDGLTANKVHLKNAVLQGEKSVQVVFPQGSKVEAESTFVLIDGVDFHNGTIEVELAGEPEPDAPKWARGFVGISFRVTEDLARFETFYLRPLNGRTDNQLQRNHSTQYSSYPDYPWSRFRKEEPGKYESYVDLVPGEWTKVKIVVKGETARLYVHGAEQPCLVVNDLKHGAALHGGIGLWVGVKTVAHFRNLRITAG